MLSLSVQGTARLTLFILRRDRLRLFVWIASFITITILVALVFPEMYGSEQERIAIAETMRNPAMTAMVGPGYGLDDYHTGAVMSHQMLLFTALTVGIMMIMLVSRHTRHDEEEGRVELIRSLPVGRMAILSSTGIVALLASLVLSLTMGFGLYSLGFASMDLEGSMLYGAVLGVSGLVFAAITALFAQLTVTNRGTIGYSFAFLMLAYILRAIGDVSSEPLALISPLGLVLRTEVYVNNYWRPIWLTIVIALIIFAVALKLSSMRDLQAGFIPVKSGRIHASRFTQTPIGLALKLQKTTIWGWIAASLLLGVSYGSVMGDLESFLGSSEMIQEMLPQIEGSSLAEQFMTMLMSIISIFSAIPALILMLKLRSEEKQNHTEHILARAVSRSHLMSSYLLISYTAAFVMQFLAVFGLWVTADAVMEESLSFSSIMQSGMIYMPAILMMIALAAFLTGIFEKAASFIWLYLGYSFLTTYLGDLLQVPEWMKEITPYGQIPMLPTEALKVVPLIVLISLIILFTIAGFWGYRQRDIKG